TVRAYAQLPSRLGQRCDTFVQRTRQISLDCTCHGYPLLKRLWSSERRVSSLSLLRAGPTRFLLMITHGRVAINRFITLKLQSAVWDGLRVFALAAPEGYAVFLAYSCQIFSLTFALPLLLTSVHHS